MFRSRSWFGGGLWKPKNPHSLEHLKYLYNVLSKNQTVSEHNRGLLVETLRAIAEILIWGDQNDSSVFDFFLEKNMLSFFLKILKQKCGSYVCVQLLQTLNILFENIRNETSLYYLLSNNHVNSIIVHKFDFSDEEVMAYYISFLKTLSLKLNAHTVHFFYNEHTNDFPLYTEAIKFFNHSESMVRIAVRTLTLNVYRVEDKSMLKFIKDKTAAPYFSNLVWFIGNHVLELDACVRNDADHQSQNRLSDLVAEHLDHLHYLNDILCLDIQDMNQVLTDHLLNKLFIPLYIYSLTPRKSEEERPRVSSVVGLFLLSQVFLIISCCPLVHMLAEMILHGATDSLTADTTQNTPHSTPSFKAPSHSLEESLQAADASLEDVLKLSTNLNITDEEKEKRRLSIVQEAQPVFLEAVVSALDCSENDYIALFALCLLYAISHNKGVGATLMDGLLLPSSSTDAQPRYSQWLVDKLVAVISLSCKPGCRVRLATLELTICLLRRLVTEENHSLLQDGHLAAIVGAKEESTSLLRNFYKSEDIFLIMFESEYQEMHKRPLNVERLMMDSVMLLPPTGTPMTGIEFTKRLPCGEEERARRAIRVFLLIRDLSLQLAGEVETQLPLSDYSSSVQVDNVLDLNNSDLIACTVVVADGSKVRRFLVMDNTQFILVEPDSRRLGWGVAKMAGFLQDIEVVGDKEDSRCLHMTINHTTSGPLVAARFIFDDHIRCLAAKQRLNKGRLKARQKKMQQIAKLLDLPSAAQPTHSPPTYNLLALRHQANHLYRNACARPLSNQRHSAEGTTEAGTNEHLKVSRPTRPGIVCPGHQRVYRRRDSGSTGHSASPGPSPSQDSSPKLPRPRSEEIPLENMHIKKESLTLIESEPQAMTSSASVVSEDLADSEETSFTKAERRRGKVETV